MWRWMKQNVLLIVCAGFVLLMIGLLILNSVPAPK